MLQQLFELIDSSSDEDIEHIIQLYENNIAINNLLFEEFNASSSNFQVIFFFFKNVI